LSIAFVVWSSLFVEGYDDVAALRFNDAGLIGGVGWVLIDRNMGYFFYIYHFF
jgi:hypothetical protein